MSDAGIGLLVLAVIVVLAVRRSDSEHGEGEPRLTSLPQLNQVLLAIVLVLVIALLIGGSAGLGFAASVLVVGAICWPLMRRRGE